jgi:hypothetical protein
MPPKQTTEPPLSDEESQLMKIAARVFTAVLFKEAHPDLNHEHFETNLAKEMVRQRSPIKLFMLFC